MATDYQAGHMQLPRADAIRSRLMDTFSLIEHLQGLSQAVPRHTLREILDPSLQKKLLLGDQHQLVRISIKPRHVGRISHAQRMMSRLRVRCSQRPPLSLWAGWVLESSLFTNFVIFLIFLNTIVLMVEIDQLDWETLVHQNLPGLMDMDQDDRVVWPRDSLFRYFELLEKLQYNLEERKILQQFAVQALMSFEDK